MLYVLAAVLAVTAFIVLVRLLWSSTRLRRSSTLITLATAALIVGLAVLAATGRLNWIAAAVAAVFPFLRRGFTLLRYLPLIGRLFQSYRQSGMGGGAQGSGRSAPGATAGMSLDQARQILDLGAAPTRDEVIAAHRRLMQKLHPDRGGSTYLAQQLNEAKRVLLKDLEGRN